MKKLFKALLILSSFSVLTRALGFIFRIFLSRLIGAEGLGVYQVAFSVFMVFETFVSSGLPLVVSKRTSALLASKNKEKEGNLVTSALVVGIITALMICLVVLLFKNIFSTLFTDSRCMGILFILIPSLVFSSVYAVLRGSLWGNKKYFLVSFTEFIEQIVRVILTVLFLGVIDFALEKVFLASLAYSISCVVSSVLVFILYFKVGGKLTKKTGEVKNLLKSSTPITIVRVMSSLLSPLISVIIPLRLVAIGYTSSQALSIFGIAMGMTFPLLYVPSTAVGSLSMTLIPDLSYSLQNKDYTEVKKKINFSIKFVYFVSFLFIPLYMALGEPICQFFYNNIEAGKYLSYSAILILPICLSSVTVSCLNALDMEIKGFLNYVIGAVLLVLCIVFLPNIMGIYSLVWGMVLCLGIDSVLNIFMVNKKLQDNFFNLKYLLLATICALPTMLISRWSFAIISRYIPLFFSLAVSSIAGAIFYILFALIFDLFDLSFIKIKKKNKIIQNTNSQ